MYIRIESENLLERAATQVGHQHCLQSVVENVDLRPYYSAKQEVRCGRSGGVLLTYQTCRSVVCRRILLHVLMTCQGWMPSFSLILPPNISAAISKNNTGMLTGCCLTFPFPIDVSTSAFLDGVTGPGGST